MTPEAVTARYGVPPERYSDLAALVGEDSDNLPGVPGVGPKTAAKWLTAYGDLAGVVAQAPRITGKAWLNANLVRAHLVLVIVGLVLLIGSYCTAASAQSHGTLAPSISFATITEQTRLSLVVATAAQGLLLLGNIAFLANFYGTACEILNISAPAWFKPAPAMETPAS